ncbi:MAG: hypothetical protein Q7S50_03580 [bacterium]|nr:hypothetical protein [bacterium]
MQTIINNWVLLCLLGGAFDGLGQLLCKRAWAPPPYVIVGTLGIMWFLCPLLLMTLGPAHIGGLSIMTLGQAAALGVGALLPAFLVGAMFWTDNLFRFDAINKAPFVGYVVVLVGISEMTTAFLIEILIKSYRGELVVISLGQVLGALCALAAIGFFWGKKFADEKADKKRKIQEGVVETKNEPFIPLNWITLAIITGVLSGLGGIFYKEDPAMPSYVFTGIIGAVWVVCSVAFIGGRAVWNGVGLRLNILSFREAKAFGPVVFGSLIVAGLLTWGANVGRFSAIDKAPLVGYVYLFFPIAAGASALILEGLVKWLRGNRFAISWYEIGGIVFAIASLVFFTMA